MAIYSARDDKSLVFSLTIAFVLLYVIFLSLLGPISIGRLSIIYVAAVFSTGLFIRRPIFSNRIGIRAISWLPLVSILVYNMIQKYSQLFSSFYA